MKDIQLCLTHWFYRPARPHPWADGGVQRNTNPKKVNLGVGVYKGCRRANTGVEVGGAPGENPGRRADEELPAHRGNAEFDRATLELLFGATRSSPQGAARPRRLPAPARCAWRRISSPRRWASARSGWRPDLAQSSDVFHAAGLATNTYPYFDKQRNAVNFAGMMDALATIPGAT